MAALPNASTAADVRAEAAPLEAALRSALSEAELVHGAPLELSAGPFQSFAAVKVEEEPVSVEALAAATGPWRLGAASPSVAKWLRLAHTIGDSDIPSAMRQAAEEQAAAALRSAPAAGVVEFCSDGVTSKEGGVCCPSSCDQCGVGGSGGGGHCAHGEGAPQQRGCCIDPTNASSKACSSAADVGCVMPATCAQDKCLLECPYDAACVGVWRRRGWSGRRRAVVQATYDRLREALSAAGLAPVGVVNFTQPSARAVDAVEEALGTVEGMVSAARLDPKVARWLRQAAAELAADAGEDPAGARGAAQRDSRNATRSNSSAGSGGARARSAAQVVLQAGPSAAGAATCRVPPVVVHDPAVMSLLQLQLPAESLDTSPSTLAEAAWARRLVAEALSASVTSP